MTHGGLPFSSLEEMARWQLAQTIVHVGDAGVEHPVGTAPDAGTDAAPHLHRLRGTHPQARHQGVVHHQHPAHHLHQGTVHAHKPPHPHHKAVRLVKAKAPHVDHARTRLHKQHQGVHHGGHRTKIHLHSQPGQLELEVGTIVTYTAPTSSAAGKASVVLQGSVARYIPDLPLTQSLPTDLAPLGAQCLVALLDPNNPADSLIMGVYNAPPARLWQGEGTVVTANAAQVTKSIVFPTPFPVGVHSVVATSQDPAWTCACRNLTRTGFDLVLTTVGHNPGAVGTPRYVQCEGAVVAVAGGSASGTLHVTFPTAYGTVHGVLATSQDPAWHAIARNLATTGFDLVVDSVHSVVQSDATYNTPNPNNAATPVVKTAGAVVGQTVYGALNVTCDWIASGELAYNAAVTVDWVANGL